MKVSKRSLSYVKAKEELVYLINNNVPYYEYVKAKEELVYLINNNVPYYEYQEIVLSFLEDSNIRKKLIKLLTIIEKTS